MQQLQSPFHSPLISSNDTYIQPEDHASFRLTPPITHVSLSQVELHDQGSGKVSVADPVDASILSHLSETAFQKTEYLAGDRIMFSIDTAGKAVMTTSADPMLTASPTDWLLGSESAAEPDHDWDPENIDLGLSSSPARTCEQMVSGMKRTLTQLLSSPPRPATPGSKARKKAAHSADKSIELNGSPLSASPPHSNPRGGTAIGDRGTGYANYAEISEIASDFEQPIRSSISGKQLLLRSTDQLAKMVTRGTNRAKQRDDIPGNTRDLMPVLRPRDSTSVKGKSTRSEALKVALKNTRDLRFRGKLRCSECKEMFSSHTAYAKHLDSKHKLSDRPYECPVDNCPWSVLGFVSWPDCSRHIKSSHLDRRLVCEICELQNKTSVFARTDALRRHLAGLHSIARVGKPFAAAADAADP